MAGFNWDNVLDFVDPDSSRACRRELQASQDWARDGPGPYPAAPATELGAQGTGGFDAQCIADADAAEDHGVLRLTQGVQ